MAPSLGSQIAYGQELRWTHFGLRPLAMGNAYVAVADDFNALFYNPAGLARLQSWNGELLNPSFELAATTGSFIDDAMDLTSGSAGDNLAAIRLMEEQSGKLQYLALGLTPHLVFPGFGFGIGFQMGGSIIFHRYPSVEFAIGPQLIAPIAYARNFLENRLSIGVAVKGVVTGGIYHEFSIQDIEAFSNSEDEDELGEEQSSLSDFVTGGTGVGADVGLLFTPIETMKPTLGISVTDLGGTSFDKFDVNGEAAGTPPIRLPSVNVGLSLTPMSAGGSYLRTSADVHAINQPVSFSKKLNFGLEWGYGRFLKLQSGLHQGYLTGGIEIDVPLLRLRLVSYGTEMGPSAGTIESRRYALQLKMLI